jgi:Protein of unknown function (DUF3311)
MAARKREARPRQAAKSGQAKSQAKTPRGLFAYWPRLLYLIPVGLILWVPFYNSTEPALAGIPFFYWYQLALVLVGAAIVLIVYLLDTRVTGVTPRAGAGVDPGATGDVL